MARTCDHAALKSPAMIESRLRLNKDATWSLAASGYDSQRRIAQLVIVQRTYEEFITTTSSTNPEVSPANRNATTPPLQIFYQRQATKNDI